MENRVYATSTAHLDTVWRWELPKTIEEFLPDTFIKNFDLIEKYPEYRFNFEGAYRYQLIEEYYPEAFEQLREYVAKGRWNPSGSEYENGDVNIPSPEAILRNILYGNRYFKEKFGKTTTDIFLPDCFGFGWALPSIMRHAGLCGFTTQKLGWGAAVPRPFAGCSPRSPQTEAQRPYIGYTAFFAVSSAPLEPPQYRSAPPQTPVLGL